jgi:hypothetical protein
MGDIMKPIETLVPLQATCKKLKELGWEEETYFFYVYSEIRKSYALRCATDILVKEEIESRIFAPTSSEFLVVLPYYLNTESKDQYLQIEKLESGFTSMYCRNSDAPFTFSHDINPAESLALLWCELKEKGAI